MTILDEPSGNQDERSQLKKDVEINTTTSSAALATDPPPYSSIAIPSPNPIPSPQAIPQAYPQVESHHVVLHRRRSPIRRFLAALLVAWLVLFLWSALLHSFDKVRHIGGRHGYEYEVVRLHSFHFLCS